MLVFLQVFEFIHFHGSNVLMIVQYVILSVIQLKDVQFFPKFQKFQCVVLILFKILGDLKVIRGVPR